MRVQKPGRYVWGGAESNCQRLGPGSNPRGPGFSGYLRYWRLKPGHRDPIRRIEQPAACLGGARLQPLDRHGSHPAPGKIPLYSLESKHPLADLILLASACLMKTSIPTLSICSTWLKSPAYLPSALLNIPLIVAGGTCHYNPEPMSDFIDAYVIGEGEGAMSQIVEVFQTPGKPAANPAPFLLEQLTAVNGIYVPSFYNPFL